MKATRTPPKTGVRVAFRRSVPPPASAPTRLALLAVALLRLPSLPLVPCLVVASACVFKLSIHHQGRATRAWRAPLARGVRPPAVPRAAAAPAAEPDRKMTLRAAREQGERRGARQRQGDRGERRVSRTYVRLTSARLRLRSRRSRMNGVRVPWNRCRGGRRHHRRTIEGYLPPQASAAARWRVRWGSTQREQCGRILGAAKGADTSGQQRKTTANNHQQPPLITGL